MLPAHGPAVAMQLARLSWQRRNRPTDLSNGWTEIRTVGLANSSPNAWSGRQQPLGSQNFVAAVGMQLPSARTAVQRFRSVGADRRASGQEPTADSGRKLAGVLSDQFWVRGVGASKWTTLTRRFGELLLWPISRCLKR